MKRFLFLLTIGPVQDFISTARRTRDLAFGSEMISEISKSVAYRLLKHGAELVVPNPCTADELRPGSDLMVANKIFALCSCSDPGEVLTDCRSAAETAWRTIASDALQEAQKTSAKRAWSIDIARFEQQANRVVEFYGAFTPCETNDVYRVARQRVMALADGTKSIRPFPCHAGVAGIPKSSLDGARETVVRHPEDPQKRTWKWELLGHEQLCAVGLVKRFGGGQKRFPSTHHMAALPWMHRVAERLAGCRDNDACLTLIKQLIEISPETTETPLPALRKIWENLSGAALFESRVEQAYPAESEDAKKHLDILAKLFDLLDDLGRPSPYYAILLGDGDHMGKFIDHLDCSGHQQLTRELSEFSHTAHQIVRSHHGALVYAGGDDVLALLPINQALEAAVKIRNAFLNAIKNVSLGEEGVLRPTFSIGLAIGHALSPLQENLEMVRKAERAAKNLGERDSLAIVLDKRSGAPTQAVFKWDELPTYQTLVDWFRQKGLSRGLPYEWRRLADELRGSSAPCFKPLVKAEMVRIVMHKKPKHGALSRKEVDEWVKERVGRELRRGGEPADAVRRIAETAVIASVQFREKEM